MKIFKEQFPADWNVELLDYYVQKGDIKLDRGKVISSIMMNKNPGTFPVYSSSAKENALFGTWGNYLIDEELISWSVDGGGYFFYRPKHKFSVTNVSGLLRVDPLKFDIRFLYYFLDWQHSSQTYNYQDKAHPSVIRQKYFVSQAEITEQRKIAHILIKLDQAITSTEQLIIKYQRIKSGILHDLLTKGIDDFGNLRNEDSYQFIDTPIGRIPKEWEIKTVRNIFFVNLGKMLNKFAKEGKNQFFYLANKNVQWDYFELSGLQTMNFSDEEVEKFSLKKGDILMCEGGEVGRCAIWNNQLESCFFQKAIHRLRYRKDSTIIPEYFTSFFKETIRSGRLKDYITQTSIAHLTKEKLELIPVSLPSYEEQIRIVSIIKSLDKIDKIYSTELTKLHKIKVGLMKDLLSGKVRLPEELLLREGIE